MQPLPAGNMQAIIELAIDYFHEKPDKKFGIVENNKEEAGIFAKILDLFVEKIGETQLPILKAQLVPEHLSDSLKNISKCIEIIENMQEL
jgi:hypothetical protein